MLATLGAHPNIVAVKLTYGGIATVAWIATAFPPKDFAAFAGQSGCEYFRGFQIALWLTIQQGWFHCCPGRPRVHHRTCEFVPKDTCVELYSLFGNGRKEAAEALQLEVATAK